MREDNLQIYTVQDIVLEGEKKKNLSKVIQSQRKEKMQLIINLMENFMTEVPYDGYIETV